MPQIDPEKLENIYRFSSNWCTIIERFHRLEIPKCSEEKELVVKGLRIDGKSQKRRKFCQFLTF